MIVAHSESEILSSEEAYHKESMDKISEGQPAILELKEKERLVSLGYVNNPDELELNPKQTENILTWIDSCRRMLRETGLCLQP